MNKSKSGPSKTPAKKPAPKTPAAGGSKAVKRPSAAGAAEAPGAPKEPPPREALRRGEGEFFYQNSMMAYGLLPFLPVEQREIVKKWMNKLNTLNENAQQITIRNDYMWFLLTQLQGGTVTIPFLKEPPEAITALNTVVEKDLYTDVLAAANKALQYLEDDKERLLRHASAVGGPDAPISEKRYRCRPSEFLRMQPKPKIGFIAYGSCFSNQYS